MLDKIQKFLKTLQEEYLKANSQTNDYISSIQDDIINKTSFEPLKRGGANFKTHNLIINEFGNYILKPNNIFLLLTFFPLVIIFLVFSSSFIDCIKILSDFNIQYLIDNSFSLFILLLFILGFGTICYFFYNIYIFDFQSGYFYNKKYKKRLYELMYNEKYNKKIIPIKNIHALQIIKEKVRTKNSSFNSYELNMILKDSSRVNILDYGNHESLKIDAEKLASRLGIKIHDLSK